MGMAASQSRLLLLTSRKSDLELRGQHITQRKMLLSMQTEEIAEDYNRAISNKTMMFTWGYDAQKNKDYTNVLTYNELTSSVQGYNSATYRVVTGDGALVVKNANDPILAEILYANVNGQKTQVATIDENNTIQPLYEDIAVADEGKKIIFNKLLDDTALFQNALKQGSLFLEAREANDDQSSSWESFSWSSSERFSESYNTTDDAVAEAKYQSEMSRIQTLEKKLDVELKQIETQQSACQTEIDSVKGVLKKSYDSFKIFQG